MSHPSASSHTHAHQPHPTLTPINLISHSRPSASSHTHTHPPHFTLMGLLISHWLLLTSVQITGELEEGLPQRSHSSERTAYLQNTATPHACHQPVPANTTHSGTSHNPLCSEVSWTFPGSFLDSYGKLPEVPSAVSSTVVGYLNSHSGASLSMRVSAASPCKHHTQCPSATVCHIETPRNS